MTEVTAETLDEWCHEMIRAALGCAQQSQRRYVVGTWQEPANEQIYYMPENCADVASIYWTTCWTVTPDGEVIPALMREQSAVSS